jgi:ABC-2 type transport system permease protein
MIRTIAQKEFTTALRDRRFILLTILIFCLLTVAALSGISSYRLMADERNAAQHTADKDFKSQPDRHPHRMAHYGSYAFRPKSTLSFLDFGLDTYTGTLVYLEAHQQNSANFSQVQQSGALIRFGEMTVAFVLQWLIPLFVIFLCFNAFTQEKEEGTLKVLLSQGITLKAIAKGKILGYSKVLALIIMPSLVFAALFIFAVNDLDWTTGLLLRLLVFVIAYACYFFIFLVGAILVSALNMHSRNALIILLGIWIFSCVILPKATANLAAVLYEAPSKAEMDAEVHEEAKNGMNGHDPQDKKTAIFIKSLLLKYKVDSVSQLPFNIDGMVMALGEKASSRVYQAHFEQLVDTYNKQNQLSVWAGFVNPYLSIRYVSMGMAGTDYAHYVDFLNAAEKYRYGLSQYLNKLQTTKLGFKDKESRLTSDLWKQYPSFQYQQPAAAWAIGKHIISLIALLSWTVLLYLLLISLITNHTKF